MLLYYAFVAVVLAFAGPFLLLAPKRRVGIGQKLGIIPAHIRARLKDSSRPIWFHSVSVGEFNAAYPLLEAILREYPQCRLVVSTATATGQKLAGERLGDRVVLTYFPLDLPWALNNWLDAINPSAVIIVETEIWPGFTHECQRRRIPMLIVNGRISLRSFKRYFAMRTFFGPVIRRFTRIIAQSQTEVDRYKAIAGPQLSTSYFGNLKFDGLKPITQAEQSQLMHELKLDADDLVFIAGSTHEGEETAVLNVLRKWNQSATGGANLRLIIAPRHPERWDHVGKLIQSSGFTLRKFSKGETFCSPNDVYLLDTIGQLFRYYSLASLAFVGGTLAPIGGHNVVEPFAYGVPVVSGPNLFKTLDVARSLKERGALTVVKDGDELSSAVLALLNSPQQRQNQGSIGKQWFMESQGAVAKTLECLRPYLDSSTSAQRTAGDGALAS